MRRGEDMLIRTSWRLGWLVSVGLATAATPAWAQSSERPEGIAVRRTVLADPQLRSGTLPNGLRYFIMRSAIPVGGLSMRLGIDVGSIEEQEAERGFAHFVEHMAFRATRSAPEGDWDRRFTPLGVAFGRDQNAETSPFATTYRLDFTSADAKGIEEGFRWLRDVADGVLFPEAGVASERGVALAEREIRESPEATASQALARFQAPGLRTIDRLPGGTRAAIAAARPDTLRAFYDRWYRPENAVLVVVGDQPPEAMEARIVGAFTSWQGKSARAVRAPLGKIDMRHGLDTFTIAAPTLPTIASACRTRPPLPRGDSEIVRTTREVRSAIWHAIVAQRFKALINAGNSGLLGAAIVGNDEREFAATCLITVPAGNAWEKGLAAAQAELRRFQKDGPTESEVDAQIAESRAALRGGIGGTRTATVLAETILQRSLDRRPVVSPREAMHAFNVAVEDLDPAAIRAAVAADWAGAGPLVALVLPDKVEPVRLRDAWMRGEQATGLAAFTDRKAVTWAYTDFGKAGAVASREVIADPGFVRLRFRNGVILNFKQSSLEANGVELRARFGAGRRGLPDDGFVGASLGTGLLTAGGLGRMSAEDLEQSLRETGWSFDFQFGTDFFQFSKSTSTSNLQIELQVFAAFMSDPGFRTALDERIPGAVDIMYRMVGSQPELALGEALLLAVDPGNPTRLPPQSVSAALRSADFEKLLKTALTGAPVELTIAGDIDEATAIGLVAETFGALPARSGGPAPRADARFLRFPNRAYPVIRTTHTGAADRAAASLVWPTYIAQPARRREEYALKLAAAVFNDELRKRVRTELGKAYDPTVLTVMPDDADQGYLTAQIASSPADLALLIDETKAVARRIGAGAITAQALESVRKPMLSEAAAFQGRNAWWAAALSGSARSSAITEELTGFGELLSAVTLDEVKSSAARWLARSPIVTVATPVGATSSIAKPARGKGRGVQ